MQQCKRGHDLTPGNISEAGACLTCWHDAQWRRGAIRLLRDIRRDKENRLKRLRVEVAELEAELEMKD